MINFEVHIAYHLAVGGEVTKGEITRRCYSNDAAAAAMSLLSEIKTAADEDGSTLTNIQINVTVFQGIVSKMQDG